MSVELWTVGEVADYLRTSPRRVYDLHAKGLPVTRLPGVGTRWRRRDVEAWVARHASDVEASPVIQLREVS